jgi:hypothetical protein
MLGAHFRYTVEPLLNQIDLPIRTRQLQFQLGVSPHEIRQGRHDRCARHLGRKIDPYPWSPLSTPWSEGDQEFVGPCARGAQERTARAVMFTAFQLGVALAPA